MEDFERAHLLEYYYLLEQEWEEYEYFKGRRVGYERCRINKARKNEWAYRAKQCSPKKDRGRKIKH